MRDLLTKKLIGISGKNTVAVETPQNSQFGDYSTNLAMEMAKEKGAAPSECARELVAKLSAEPELKKIFSKIEVKEPGFINFWLDDEFLTDELEKILAAGQKYGVSEAGKGKTVVIDYSSPNIAKPFGVGHLRSTVIGQALYNLYKYLGFKVIGDNHLGDWGTQFGVLLYKVHTGKAKKDNLTISGLEKLYVQFHKEAEVDPKLWDEARAWFKKLEDGEAEAKRLWKLMVDLSMHEFNKVYTRLGVKIDYAYGESFYQDYMEQVIKLVRTKGLSKKSEEAEIVEMKGLPPAMLIKKDGTTTYFTRDLATIHFRIGSWDPKLIIYEVGSEQILHFRQVFAAAKLLGWGKDRDFVHVSHGLIRFEHGKMSTRKGASVKLDEVLDEAVSRAKKIIETSETSRGLSEEAKNKVAEQVGIGAIKYFDLSHQPQSDIIFNWEKMFQMEGNSAPYLQYTVARINSVIAKAAKEDAKPAKDGGAVNEEERLVIRSLAHMADVIADAAKNYSPNLFANYLFDLAQKYNNFYNTHRIIGSDNLIFRLRLSSATAQVLSNGLGILGIDTPERM